MIKEPRYISFLTLQALHTQTLLGTFDNHFCNYSVSPSGCGKATGATTHYNSSFCKIITFTVSILVELPVLSVEQFTVLYSQDLPGIWAHWSRFLCTFCSCSSLNRSTSCSSQVSQIGTFQPPCFWKPEKEEVIVCYIWRSLPSSPCWSAWWARTLLHTLLGTPWLFHQGRSWDGTGASWGTLCRLDFRRNHIFRCWDCRTSNQRREAGLARLQPHLPSDKPNPLLP